jgi:hypothetical protein
MTRARRLLRRATIGSLAIVLTVAGAGGPAPARAQGGAPVSPGPRVLKLTPGMSPEALRQRPDHDLVELSDGRRVRLGDVRRLTAAVRRMRAASGDGRPPALRTAPASTGRRVTGAADLATALQGSDRDTLVLPSGRRVTVGQIRLVQPQIEKRLGRPLGAVATGRQEPTGPALEVGAKPDWKSLLERPDSTVLKAPDGTRVTVGEIKQALAAAPVTTGGAPRAPR